MRITTYFQDQKNAEFIPAIMNCFRYTRLIMASVWTTDLVSNYWTFLIQFASNIEHFDSKISKQLIKGHGLLDFPFQTNPHESFDVTHITTKSRLVPKTSN